MIWWVNSFGECFSEPLNIVIEALTGLQSDLDLGFNAPLSFLNPSEEDIKALKVCLDIYDSGVVDLFALRIFAGENGLIRSFIALKLRLQYLDKSSLNKLELEEEDLRSIYMGDHEYLRKKLFDTEKLKVDTISWIHECVETLKTQENFNFSRDSWAVMKSMSNGHSDLCGGIVVTFSAILLCIDLDLHLDKIDPKIFVLTFDILRRQHAIDEDHTENRFVRETIMDFITAIIKYESSTNNKYNILSKNLATCNVIADKLYETSCEGSNTFLINETARRMRDEMCIICKFMAETTGFPSHKDLYNFGIVPSLQTLRLNSWGQEASITELCEDILSELLGSINHLDNFTGKNSFEFASLKLLGKLRGIYIREGHHVIHQYFGVLQDN